MTKVRNIVPQKEREAGTGRALGPFTHSMEELFDNYFPRRWMEGFFEPYSWRRPMWHEYGEAFELFPKVDMIDKKDTLVVRAELPGIKKEDLQITIEGDRLSFEARREFEEDEKKDDFFRHEMAYGRLHRTVHLPVEVMADKVKAGLKNGILEIYLPKVEATTPYTVKVA